ncbi:MAG TPA: protein kinase [Pirellulales bacterium]|nr:protein kinase [Pirellulales bacterium]
MMDDEHVPGPVDARLAGVYDDFCEALRRGEQSAPEPWLAERRDSVEALSDLRVIAALHDAGRVLAGDSRLEATRTWTPGDTVGGVAYEPLAAGDRLGEYVIERLLGAGGMGEVYLAEHKMMGRSVAIKVLPGQRSDAPERLRRFHTEIRAQGRLGTHPNLAVAHDAGEHEGRVYLVLEYVPGNDLQAKVAQSGTLPCDVAHDCVRQAAEALAFAHKHGIVHRDVKPSNLMLTPQGQVKLLDLGLAQLAASESQATDATRTQAGLLMGTPDYIAPEQAQDASRADARSDLYSLGCTWYYLLTGRPPFAGGSAIEKLRAHALQPPPCVLESRPDVPPVTAAMMEMLMAKRPEDRYLSAEELLEDLGHGAKPAGAATHRAVGKRRPLSRVQLAAIVVVPFVAIGAVLYGISSRWSGRPDPSGSGVSPKVGVFGNAGAEAATIEPSTAPPDEIKATMRIEQFRAGPADEMTSLGNLGDHGGGTRVGDRVAVEAEMDVPCYAYLLAVNPDASCQLLFPEPDAEQVTIECVRRFVCPVKPDDYLTLDAAGGTAFVLVASREPLGAFDDWAPRVDVDHWHAVGATGWSFDGHRLEPLARQRVGTAQHGPAALAELCRKLQARRSVAAVRAIAFDVLPNVPSDLKDQR